MPFRLWFYLAHLVGPILFAIIFFTFAAAEDSFSGRVRQVAMYIFVLLGITGVVLGLLFAIGRLRMRCPFCSKLGRIGVRKSDGLCMECETCGTVHGSGPLRLFLTKEKIEQDD